MPGGANTESLVSARTRDVLERHPELYETLRRIARREHRRSPSATLNTTVIVHEAWLRLNRTSDDWRNADHYVATAAIAMRQLLVDYARRKAADKRTRPEDSPLIATEWDPRTRADDVLAVDAALGELEPVEPRLVRLIELRFFAGLTTAEASRALDMSERTAAREWRKARAWLAAALEAA